jgi:uncharacterized damage-inducible protein DinB
MVSDTRRQPIGSFTPDSNPTPEKRQVWIQDLSEHPMLAQNAVADLSTSQLDTRHRPDGWTIRQIIHHLADNQVLGYFRMRWALTEDSPTVQLYDQDAWAALPDAAAQPVRASVDTMHAVYRRWTYLLKSLGARDFECAFEHPAAGRITLDHALQMYDWHGRHHIAQITALREEKGW